MYRFTRALFKLTCSPFLLGGVIDHQVKLWQNQEPDVVAEIWKNLYADNLFIGKITIDEVCKTKSAMKKDLSDAIVKLPK